MGLCDVQATEADIVPGDQMDIFPYAFVDEAGSPVPAEAVGCFAHIRICGNALLRDGLHLHDGGEFDVHRLYLRQQGSDGVPAEAPTFANGPHGTGLGKGDAALDQWPNLLENWLRAQG